MDIMRLSKLIQEIETEVNHYNSTINISTLITKDYFLFLPIYEELKFLFSKKSNKVKNTIIP